MGFKRQNINSSLDIGQATSIEHSELAGAKKVTMAGPYLEIVGTLGTAKQVQYGTSLWIYNNSATVAYVAFFNTPTETVVAPSSLTTGIPIPPNSYIYLNVGPKNTVIASAATVAAYRLVDETKLNISYP